VPDRLTSRVVKVGFVGSPSSLDKKFPFSEIPALAITTSMLPTSLYICSNTAFCSSQFEMSHFLKIIVDEGNSERKQEMAEQAEFSEMSRMLSLVFFDAKNLAIARPMPEAPPKRCQNGVQQGDERAWYPLQ
jgi:hypothetical protein